MKLLVPVVYVCPNSKGRKRKTADQEIDVENVEKTGDVGHTFTFEYERTSVTYMSTECYGRGAFGVVYGLDRKGTSTCPLPDRLAVKVLPKCNSNADGEVRLYQKLPTHKNIVQLFLVGKDATNYYLFMEAGSTFTLRELVVKHGSSLKLQDVISLGRNVLQAVAHCHTHGIAHRDVKLENFIFAKDPKTARRVLKLLDFGSGTSIGELVLSIAGTPHYAPPECAMCVLNGRRSRSAFPQDTVAMDSWCCGVVLWELTWRGKEGLFNAEKQEQVLQDILAFAGNEKMRNVRVYDELLQRCRERDASNVCSEIMESWVTLIYNLLHPDPGCRLSVCNIVSENASNWYNDFFARALHQNSRVTAMITEEGSSKLRNEQQPETDTNQNVEDEGSASDGTSTVLADNDREANEDAMV